jgi:minor fimbrial subunit
MKENNMKRLFGAVVLLALSLVTTVVKAADCRVNGGNWQRVNIGGTLNLQVPVNVRLEVNEPRILLSGVRIECRFEPDSYTPDGRQDYWATGTRIGPAWSPGPKFVNQTTGLRINGTYLDTPIPAGIRVATMPNNTTPIPIDVIPYILIRNNPTNPIDIRIGDTLGVLRLDQTNNYDSGSTSLQLTYIANNDFTISPSSCTINNNNPININFGNVHQRAIGTDPLSTSIRVNQRLSYSCPDGGINTPITITYKGTPTSFNANLLTMSNGDVGTAMVRAGAAVRVNGAFQTRITNSTGSDDVTFALVKRNGSLPAEGPVTGSGVLVMGVP